MESEWFPDHKRAEQSPFLDDRLYDDFDAPNATFARTYAHVDTIQLTPGPYRARVTLADLKEIEYSVEYKSQSLQRTIKRPPDRFVFRVILEPRGAHTNFGVEQAYNTIYAQPPLGEVTAINDPGSTILAISVDHNALMSHPTLLPDVADWLANLEPRGAFIMSDAAARHLCQARGDIFSLLLNDMTEEKFTYVSDIALQQLASALTLGWVETGPFSDVHHVAAFERFRRVLDGFQSIISDDENSEASEFLIEEFKHLGSKRSIEKAFKASVGMGPLQYWRLVRLHNVRRKLLQSECLDQTIGDIAAEEGFLDPSRFGYYYGRQFGERPSDTRRRLDSDKMSRRRPQLGAG